MTTGIAVRYLQGLPKDKTTDPAIVVLDEGCRFAISLLSGHEGGANRLAYRVANLTELFRSSRPRWRRSSRWSWGSVVEKE